MNASIGVGVGARAWACVIVRVALLILHATRMRHIACGFSGGTTFFFDVISSTTRPSGQKFVNVKCVFYFLYKGFSETLPILRKIQRDTVINVKTFSCEVSVILVGF
jgi:hypothetical protein